jgi:hypothetical protein
MARRPRVTKRVPICCICGTEIPDSSYVVEIRPTGESGGLEDWSYCSKCWLGMQELRCRSIDRGRLRQAL